MIDRRSHSRITKAVHLHQVFEGSPARWQEDWMGVPMFGEPVFTECEEGVCPTGHKWTPITAWRVEEA